MVQKNRVKGRAYTREYRKKYPERVRASQRKIKYGITVEDFNNMFISQSGRCAICKVEIDDSANVDHDHKTGKIRGLLCRRCNLGLAWFNDNIQILMSAIAYLGKV